MRIKLHYYDTNGSMAITTVLYRRELDFLAKNHGKLLEVVDTENVVNSLHALLLIAHKVEEKDVKSTEETQHSAVPAVSGA